MAVDVFCAFFVVLQFRVVLGLVRCVFVPRHVNDDRECNSTPLHSRMDICFSQKLIFSWIFLGRRMVAVAVYRDGFTVDGGPFRPLTDPKNKAFADALGKLRRYPFFLLWTTCTNKKTNSVLPS